MELWETWLSVAHTLHPAYSLLLPSLSRYEGNPCNMHLMDLAAEVKKGVEEIGLVGFRFNTIGRGGVEGGGGVCGDQLRQLKAGGVMGGMRGGGAVNWDDGALGSDLARGSVVHKAAYRPLLTLMSYPPPPPPPPPRPPPHNRRL